MKYFVGQIIRKNNLHKWEENDGKFVIIISKRLNIFDYRYFDSSHYIGSNWSECYLDKYFEVL